MGEISVNTDYSKEFAFLESTDYRACYFTVASDICKAGGGRPLTFKENIEAIVRACHEVDPKYGGCLWRFEGLLGNALASRTGVIVKPGNKKIKILGGLDHLRVKLLRKKECGEDYLPVKYRDVEGIEVPFDHEKYGKPLGKSKILSHEGWLAALEGDKHLLKEYCDLFFNYFFRGKKKEEGKIAFTVDESKYKDILCFLSTPGLSKSILAPEGPQAIGVEWNCDPYFILPKSDYLVRFGSRRLSELERKRGPGFAVY